MSENNDNSSDSNSRGDGVSHNARLTNPIRSSVLRPSLFGSNLNSTHTTDQDKPESVEVEQIKQNPFLKDNKDSGAEAPDSQNEEKDKDEKGDSLSILSKNGLPRSNPFTAAKAAIPRMSSGFVFGQNVHERVTGENIASGGESSTSNNEKDNESAGSLFASVINNTKADTDVIKETETKSLDEVAREYEESRAQKRKYEEVETFTGEENEVNIVDISCKLFAFVNSNWEERGRGSLRLNDSKNENECSRVVFRTSGNLRLLVNTKVWHGMVAERPSPKSLRLTAIDNAGQIKIWLAMSRPDDINVVHKALVERINIQKDLHPNGEDGDSESLNGTAEKNETADLGNNGKEDVENIGESSPKKVTTNE